jgi:hypothetical protein
VGWITVVPGVQQGTTNFLIATLQIAYPDLAVLAKRWFAFVITTAGLILAILSNIYDQRILKWYFRFTVFSATLPFVLYWIWLPVKASGKPHPGTSTSSTMASILEKRNRHRMHTVR